MVLAGGGTVAFVSEKGAPFGGADGSVWSNAAPGSREAEPRDHPRPPIRCSEIDCLRHRLAPRIVAAAEARARALNIGADEVLIAQGEVTPEAYCRALAFSLQLRFVALDALPRTCCAVQDEVLVQSFRALVLPLQSEGRRIFVVAPRGVQARALVALVRGNATLRDRIWLTTPERMRRFVERHCGGFIAHRAAEALRVEHPILSAAQSRSPRRVRAAGLLSAAALAAAAVTVFAAPYAMLAGVQVFASAAFLAAACLRLLVGLRRNPPALPATVDEAILPRYSIVAAVYDEVEALPELLAALNALDYPPEKREILLVLERDDAWTRLIAEFLQSRWRFDIVLATERGPRTKPKALNCALPFMHGDLVVVYDAEDRPEPDQLRRAADAFLNGEASLACVQARLTVDNTDDSWLSRLFTAEYCGLFDVLLPGLAALRLPIPLGGSSNHFRASVLRAVGGWDPYNVTEDADLGIRLARFGYTSGVIDSTTYEEAPARLRPWLRQRTRWIKGWMQTLLVHARQPLRLCRDVGPSGALAFYLILGTTIATALVQPLAVSWLGAAALGWVPLAPSAAAGLSLALGWFHLCALVAGYASSAFLAFIGLKRRGLTRVALAFVALPLLWGLLSVAAWRALIQLVRRPHFWEKTQHGRARTSRLGARQAAQLYLRRSAAASSGLRFRLKGATNRPSLSIR